MKVIQIVFQKRNLWLASHYQSIKNSNELKPDSQTVALFGTHHIETPFDISMCKHEVAEKIQSLNPNAIVEVV